MKQCGTEIRAYFALTDNLYASLHFTIFGPNQLPKTRIPLQGRRNSLLPERDGWGKREMATPRRGSWGASEDDA
jgi:hypothetical protein